MSGPAQGRDNGDKRPPRLPGVAGRWAPRVVVVGGCTVAGAAALIVGPIADTMVASASPAHSVIELGPYASEGQCQVVGETIIRHGGKRYGSQIGTCYRDSMGRWFVKSPWN